MHQRSHHQTRARASRRRRTMAAWALVALGIALVAAARPLTGQPGATVGAVVLALTLVLLAAAIGPHDPSPEERLHRELEAIWAQARPAAEPGADYDRYAVWAEAEEDRVLLMLVRRSAANAYAVEETRELDPEDAEAAAEAMERLRDHAAIREEGNRRRLERRRLRAERAEAEASRAAEEAGGRRAQADAVARAIRRP